MIKLRSIIGACIGSPLVLLAACNLNSITDSANSIDGELITPDVIESKEGARWVYLGAVARFNDFFGRNTMGVARFTDEVSVLPDKFQDANDARINNIRPEEESYYVAGDILTRGQSTKVQLQQATQLIDKYYGSSGSAMKVHSQALLGLFYIIIADNYCSGIAISESNYGGEFIPGPALSRDSLYMRAVASADNGLSINIDSVPLNNLLKGVKARALNNLGRYKEAAEAIADVPDAFSLGEIFSFSEIRAEGVGYQPLVPIAIDKYHILNSKGLNGVIWVADSSAHQDMRIPVRTNAAGNYIYPLQPEYFSAKKMIAFFSGAEARLIEAEYHLQEGNIPQFIEKINSVRRLYKQRSGSTLPDIVDPGNHNSRVDLLFKERAYTLYLTGRRIADMRRLTSHYGREPETVWPTGKSEGAQFIMYGSNYFFVPEVQGNGSEANLNPNYNRCENYDI